MKVNRKEYMAAVNTVETPLAARRELIARFEEFDAVIEAAQAKFMHPSRRMRGGDRVPQFNGVRDGGTSKWDSCRDAHLASIAEYEAPAGLSEEALAALAQESGKHPSERRPRNMFPDWYLFD